MVVREKNVKVGNGEEKITHCRILPDNYVMTDSVKYTMELRHFLMKDDPN